MNIRMFRATLYLLLLNINLIAQCHLDDWTALKALYDSTNGDSWEEKEGWEQVLGETPPPNCNLGEMKGVRLDEDYNTRVEDLFLISNNLLGELPNEINKLAKLKNLSMPFNQISGNIPSTVGELQKLDNINFDFNLLSGSIPPEIGNLNELTFLYLSGNQLSGEIPAELADLESIFQIHLDNNQLTGEIPAAFSNIMGRSFQLILHNNQLTGSIPPEFGNLLFLNAFNFTLFNNNLSGCFDANLMSVCDSFRNGVYGFQDSISEGNDFDATWREFCYEDKGICDTNKMPPLVGSFNCE